MDKKGIIKIRKIRNLSLFSKSKQPWLKIISELVVVIIKCKIRIREGLEIMKICQ